MGFAANARSRDRGYRTRAVLRDAATFAKGVLIGGIVVIALWLLLA